MTAGRYMPVGTYIVAVPPPTPPAWAVDRQTSPEWNGLLLAILVMFALELWARRNER